MPPEIYTKITRNAEPLITSVYMSSEKTLIIAEASAGTLARYTIVLSYEEIYMVLVNNTPIPLIDPLPPTGNAYKVEQAGDYLRLEVQAEHKSPIYIQIYPPSPAVGGKLLIVTRTADTNVWIIYLGVSVGVVALVGIGILFIF